MKRASAFLGAPRPFPDLERRLVLVGAPVLTGFALVVVGLAAAGVGAGDGRVAVFLGVIAAMLVLQVALRRFHAPLVGVLAALATVAAMPALLDQGWSGVGVVAASVCAAIGLLAAPGARPVYHLAMAGIWLGELAWPASRHLGLVAQAAVYVVIGVGMDLLISAVEEGRDRYETLFTRAPISLWEEDFSAVAEWMDALRREGVSDLDAYVADHPDALTHAFSLVEVRNANPAAARLIGAHDVSSLLGPLAPDTFTADTEPSFMAQLKAVWEGRSLVTVEVRGRAMDGRPIDCLLQWAALPDGSGHPDYGRVVVAIEDVTALKAAQHELAASNGMLFAIAAAQQAFIDEQSDDELFGDLLQSAVILSGSRCGLVASVDAATGRYLPLGAFDRVSGACRHIEEAGSLLDLVVAESRVVVAGDSQGGALGPLSAFMGIPLLRGRQLVGLIALGDRDGGYEDFDEAGLDPLVGTLGNLITVKWDQAERRAAELRLETVLTGAPVVLYTVDPGGKVALAVGAGLETIGLEADSLVGRPAADAFAASPQMQRGLQRALAGHSYSDVVAFGGAYLDVRHEPLCNAEGAVLQVIGVATDVTDQQIAEHALREQEDRLRAVVTGAPIVLFAIDRNGIFTLSEGSGLDKLGLLPGEVVGRSIFEVYAEDPTVLAMVRRALQGESFTEVFELDGVVWQARLRPMFDDFGVVAGVIGVSTDVTDYRRMEKELEESRERYRLVMDHVSDLVYTIDGGGKVGFVSPSVREILGYPPEDVVGTPVMDLLHDDDVGRVLAVAASTLPGESTTDIDHRVRHSSGRYLSMEARATNLLDDPGVSGWVVTARDVTDRVRARQALAESETRFRFLAENSSDIMARHGQDGTFTYVSPASETLTGYPPHELVGRRMQDLVHPDDVAAVDHAFASALSASETVLTPEYRVATATGAYRWFEASLSVVREEGATGPTGVQSNVRDVTQRHEAQEELAAAKEAAEIATRAKSEFLASVSHEIRTPMNAVLGMTDLALATELTDEQREYLTTLRTAADSLLTIINDLLDLSKVEAGKLELETIPFDLRQAVEETVRIIRVRAAEKGLDLRLEIGEKVPDRVVGDPGRLRQVLINLIGNAVKFTGAGGIRVTVTVEGNQADDVMLRFAVADTGIGIPADKLGSIFHAFSQADGSTARRFGGTGLGLAISSLLVGLMGGRISVESEPGEGSTFSFVARFAVDAEVSASRVAPAPTDQAGGSVLVVAATPAVRRRLVASVAVGGFTPNPAGGLFDALSAAEYAIRQGAPPVAVVVESPDADPELCRRLAESEALEGIPIVVIAGSGERGDAAVFREAGASGYLARPLSDAELIGVLEAVVSGRAQQGSLITRHWLRERRRRLRVLVADDSPTNRILAARLLEKRGHHVTAVGSGRDAVEQVAKTAFDVVLMDVQMPEVDGLEATGMIRAREAEQGGPRVPIVALTAHAMEAHRRLCLEAGMDAYISKPFDAGEMFALVERVAGPDQVGRDEPGVAATGGIDRRAALASVHGDETLLVEVARTLLTESARLEASMAAAVDEGQAAGVVDAAVELRRSLETIGAVDAARAVGRLADTARTDAPGSWSAALDDAFEQLRRVEGEIVALATLGLRAWG